MHHKWNHQNDSAENDPKMHFRFHPPKDFWHWKHMTKTGCFKNAISNPNLRMPAWEHRQLSDLDATFSEYSDSSSNSF